MLDEKVYVGAGASVVYFGRSAVMVYNIPNDEWSSLPEYDCYWFGMTSVDKSLVFVGGVTQDDSEFENRTNKLGMWNEKLKNWTHALPPMPTARSGPTVATYKNRWIMVAGGFTNFHGYHSTVEILDILTGYWHQASPLPAEQYKMSSIIIGNMWYLLGGYITGIDRSTLCVCVYIDDLIYDAVFQTSSESPWQFLPDTPASMGTALGLNRALLALGGYQYNVMPDIHLYKPSCSKWVKIGELYSDREECACTILPNGEIFIVGGGINSDSMLVTVNIGSLKL